LPSLITGNEGGEVLVNIGDAVEDKSVGIMLDAWGDVSDADTFSVIAREF